MKKETVLLLLLVVGAFTRLLYAEKKPYVKKTFVLYPQKINPPSRDFTSKYLEEHFEDYKKMYDKIGCVTPKHFPMLVSIPYYYKINLKKHKELKEIGLDLVRLSSNNFIYENLNEQAVRNHLVFTGTITDKINIPELSSPYHEYLKVEVDEILKGKEFFDEKVDIIKIFLTTGRYIVKVNGKVRDDIKRSLPVPYKVGEKFIIFSAFSSEDFENKYRNNIFSTGDTLRYYVDRIDYIDVKLEDPVDFNDRTNLRGATFRWYGDKNNESLYSNKDVIKLKEFIKEYKKINDAENFYKRSYK